MPLALKLAELDPPLTVSPEDLFTTLTRSAINLQSLLNELQCSKDEVQRTLNDPSTGELLRLKTQLVTLQLKLLALEYSPHAFAKLVNLMNTSEKPEVTRRAAATVLGLAGISTRTSPAKPEPPPQQTPPASPELPELDGTASTELLEAVATILDFTRNGLDLSTVPDHRLPDLREAIRPFCAPNPNSDP